MKKSFKKLKLVVIGTLLSLSLYQCGEELEAIAEESSVEFLIPFQEKKNGEEWGY